MDTEAMTTTELVTLPQYHQQVATLETFALNADSLIARKGMLKRVMDNVMQDGTHYGKIPGCGDKPSLLKPGAEAISSTFQLCPRYHITKTELGGGHREYELVCELYNPAGGFIGQGVGSATTMEGKYRYRVGGGEATDTPVPQAFWTARKSDPRGAARMLKEAANAAGVNGDSFGTQKVDGVWMITTKSADAKVEHDNPADYYNTVLKMAKKRAFVDAVLTATGASDIFTQDIEDMPETIPGAARTAQPRPQDSAVNNMDGIPRDWGTHQHAQAVDFKKAVLSECKKRGIDLNDLCLSLTESNSFKRPVNRVADLNPSEAEALHGWLIDGTLDFLAQDAA